MKYYTPEIEEFYVGFEFEVYTTQGTGHHNEIDLSSGKWKPFKLRDYWDLPEVRDSKFTNKTGIRVKYLDKEDIESLGFRHFQLSKYNLDPYSLERIGIDNKICIRYFGESIFYGKVKNISELRRLLIQLGL